METGDFQSAAQKAEGATGNQPPSYNGPFSDPVYKQIALHNGEINRMTKEQLKKRLAELKLDTRGVKEVLKKRLKNVYKKQKLMMAKVKTPSNTHHYNYLLVIDFEATCQEHNPMGFKYEIIEFPIILIDTHTRKVIDEFHSFVKPVLNPKLSDFCMELTGIKQYEVDQAEHFPNVVQRVTQWVEKHRLGEGNKFAVVTDGPWDMARFLYLQCHISQVAYPRWARRWINVRKSFSNFYGFRRSKLAVMLENMGMSFQGHQHSGIDDARNIARIAVRMMEDGADLRVNERLYSHKLKDLKDLEPEVMAITYDPGHEDSDSQSEEDTDLSSRDSSLTEGPDTNSASSAMENLSISEGHNKYQNGNVETQLPEGYDDLLAYYALQST